MNMNLKSGNLLIASPKLPDVFNRAVILLSDYNEKGAFGLIINKKLEVNLKDIVEDFSGIDAPVYFGGPVDTGLVSVIHRIGDKIGGFEISDGIYFNCDLEKLISLAENHSLNLNDIKFFLGYAGWGEKQLEKEFNNNDWYIANGLEKYIFNTNISSLWSKILRDMGKEYALISLYPENPSLN